MYIYSLYTKKFYIYLLVYVERPEKTAHHNSSENI